MRIASASSNLAKWDSNVYGKTMLTAYKCFNYFQWPRPLSIINNLDSYTCKISWKIDNPIKKNIARCCFCTSPCLGCDF